MDDITPPSLTQNQNPAQPPVQTTGPAVQTPPMAPKKKKSATKWLVLLLILLLLAAGGVFGWMWWSNKNKKQPPTTNTAQEQTTLEPKAAVECSDGFTAYENKDEKFAFCYPTSWGEAKTEKPATDEQASNVTKGTGIRITFSKETKAKAGLKSVDYEALGHGGACGLFLGIVKVDDFTNVKTNTTTGDSSGDNYKRTDKIIKQDDDTFIAEAFTAGSYTDGPGGECYGVEAHGYQLFNDKTKYVGIVFFWGGSPKDPLALSAFDTYKANPDTYFSATERTNFTTTVQSAVSI